MNPKTKTLVFFLIFSRILVLVLTWLTITLLFPDGQHLNFFEFTQTSWNRWDAPHYLYLAQNWYTKIGDPANFIVFFPLYPLILKTFLLTNVDLVTAGVFVSIVFFILGAYFFYKTIAIDYTDDIAKYATVALAIFPTSYFFNAPYTESLFLFLISVSFYSARKENWILSGLFAGLATITRPFGFLVLFAIITEWMSGKKKNFLALPILVFPTILAGISYLYINKATYGNFFEFQKILAVHWQKYLASPFASILDSWRIALGGGLTNYTILVGWAEALTITISWILIPFAFWKLRKSWAVFYALSIIFFSSTSFILSTPRYILSIPPFFILLAFAEKNYFFRLFFDFVSIALLFCLSIIFARGQWAF